MLKYIQTQFVLQWHITNKCERNCLHCYIDKKEREIDSENKISKEKCINIIDDLSSLISKWKINGRINFTGGNPLLREDFPEILNYAVGKGIIIGILGNPYPLNDFSEKSFNNC